MRYADTRFPHLSRFCEPRFGLFQFKTESTGTKAICHTGCTIASLHTMLCAIAHINESYSGKRYRDAVAGWVRHRKQAIDGGTPSASIRDIVVNNGGVSDQGMRTKSRVTIQCGAKVSAAKLRFLCPILS
jgi:hypothetical protein